MQSTCCYFFRRRDYRWHIPHRKYCYCNFINPSHNSLLFLKEWDAPKSAKTSSCWSVGPKKNFTWLALKFVCANVRIFKTLTIAVLGAMCRRSNYNHWRSTYTTSKSLIELSYLCWALPVEGKKTESREDGSRTSRSLQRSFFWFVCDQRVAMSLSLLGTKVPGMNYQILVVF